MGDSVVNIECKCPVCGEVVEIAVRYTDYLDWKHGTLVQKAFPYLDANDRERIMTGICPTCWDKITVDEEH